MRHRSIRGRLLHTGPDGERGREWFTFTVHGDGSRILRAQSEIEEGQVLRAFGSHAITADGLMTAIYDYAGPARQHFDKLPISFGFDYLGLEDVEVPAGRFSCHRLRYVLEGSAVDGHPTYGNWVTTDGDCVIVKAFVSRPKDYLYEMVEFERQGG